MANIIYSKLDARLKPTWGQYDVPIKTFIQDESNECEKTDKIISKMYNVRKSNLFAEAYMGETDFDKFEAVPEGGEAPNDTIDVTNPKYIEHIQFMKKFTITANMKEDSNIGIGSDAESKARKFTRAYYKTRYDLAARALFEGTKDSIKFNNYTVPLTTFDGKSLFNNAHKITKKEKVTQSNYFWKDLSKGGVLANNYSNALAEAIDTLNNKMINMLDENGEVMGYMADTIIVPGDQPALIRALKAACGTDRVIGANHNDINVNDGNWTLIMIPQWHTQKSQEFIVMSSEANRNLDGSVFFDRIPLKIRNYEDLDTGNFNWVGRTRMGVGHNTYKHVLKFVNASGDPGNCTPLED